ncbi:DUF6471 domain-containing protein [Pseudodesulfovibrio indicus]|nr:DUF6471 domain-containing protein [Pseudodesulfovibrio indicus]
MEIEALRIVKSELARRGVSHKALAGMLTEAGYSETISGIRGKMHRGTFSFAWVLQCCEVLQIDVLVLTQPSMQPKRAGDEI